MVPPCFTPASRQGPYGVLAYSRALTGAPVAACACGSQPRRSETIFSQTFRTRFHQSGLSVPYLPAYSSLPRVCRAYSVPLGLCLVYNRMAPSVNCASYTKSGSGKPFGLPLLLIFYIAPGMRFSLLTFCLALRRPAPLDSLVRRLSMRTARWVPMDWKICTRITSTRTDTYMMIYIRRW